MKKLLSLTVLSLGLAFGAAHAADAPAAKTATPAAPNSQQNKMSVCNQEAGDKKGDERKAFMKQCLSAQKKSQQEKMKACNADPKAKALKGDERKAFMKDCLSSHPAA